MNPVRNFLLKDKKSKKQGISNGVKRFTKILVTAGPTREMLDSIRFISNLSTGNMGYEIADEAVERGYKVTLISGPTNLIPPKGARFIRVEGASEMDRAVRRSFKRADCLFMASAVCDWRPRETVHGKIKRGSRKMSLRLVQNPDILKKIGKVKDGKLVIGFALESKALVRNAKQKLKKKSLDLIVANKIGEGKTPFGSGKTDVTIIDRYGRSEDLSNITKGRIAKEILNKAERLWQEER